MIYPYIFIFISYHTIITSCNLLSAWYPLYLESRQWWELRNRIRSAPQRIQSELPHTRCRRCRWTCPQGCPQGCTSRSRTPWWQAMTAGGIRQRYILKLGEFYKWRRFFCGRNLFFWHTQRSLQPIVQGEHLNKYRMVIAIGLQLPASKWDMPLDTEESIASCWTSMRSRKVIHVRNGILFPSRGEPKEITGSLNLVWT